MCSYSFSSSTKMKFGVKLVIVFFMLSCVPCMAHYPVRPPTHPSTNPNDLLHFEFLRFLKILLTYGYRNTNIIPPLPLNNTTSTPPITNTTNPVPCPTNNNSSQPAVAINVLSDNPANGTIVVANVFSSSNSTNGTDPAVSSDSSKAAVIDSPAGGNSTNTTEPAVAAYLLSPAATKGSIVNTNVLSPTAPNNATTRPIKPWTTANLLQFVTALFCTSNQRFYPPIVRPPYMAFPRASTLPNTLCTLSTLGRILAGMSPQHFASPQAPPPPPPPQPRATSRSMEPTKFPIQDISQPRLPVAMPHNFPNYF